MMRPTAQSAAPTLWLSAFLSVLAVNCWKGFWPGVQGWGLPYWFVDYRDGFVRRGLAGQLFQTVFGRLSVGDLTGPVLAVHLLAIGAIGLASAWLAAQTAARLRGVDRLTFLACASWLFAAQVWPSLTYTSGYLDPLVVAIAVAAALLFWAGRIVAPVVLVAIGPLVHEYFFFLLPFVLAAGLRPGRPARAFALMGTVGLASVALVTFAANRSASLLQIARMPLPDDVKHTLATVTFTQSIRQSVAQMVELLGRSPGYTLFNGLFFLLPAFVACAGLLFWRGRPNRTSLLQAAAGLFPVAALLVAWDLSRLLVMACVTTGVLFLLVARARTGPAPDTATSGIAPRTHGLWAAASIGLAAVYGGLPLVYSYFQPSPVLFRYPLPLDQSGPALGVKEPLETLWAQRPPLSGVSDLTCSLVSDKPGAQRCSPVVQKDAVLSAPIAVMRGVYRLDAAFDPVGACDGRVAVRLITPHGLAAAAGARLGGRIDLRLDIYFPARQTVATAQVVGMAAGDCVRVSRFTVTPLRDTP